MINTDLNITPVLLAARELEVRFGLQTILDKASLSIHEGDRIGLVGRNGAGKSTFLKIISGLIEPDAGEIARRKDITTGFLSQEFTLDEKLTVYENIMSGAADIIKLLNDYETLPFDSPLRPEIEVQINRHDAWNLEKRISMLMQSLSTPDGSREITYLSGGEKRRIALCRALACQPDLLIMDEPTNHLDTKSIEWIENYLASYSGTCIFVTHDRYFLDRIATRIVELADGTFYSHNGNYTDFLINKSERLAIKEAGERKRQNFLRRELQWVMRGPKARGTKSKSRLDNYYEVASANASEDEMDVELIIPPAEKLGKKVLELINTGMDIGGVNLFNTLNFSFQSGRRLGVIGHNGAGKTTLLKMLMGTIKPSEGRIEIGEKTEFNYVDQTRLILNDEDTVIQAIGQGNETIKFGSQQITVWTYLHRFLFSDDRINTIIGRLSGGERSRITLAKILMNGGNFLLLDEPTNDLDLPTLRILEEALLAFEGCLVVVSHDRYFLNRVCNGILAFEEEGNVHFSEGGYDYYLEKRERRLADAKPETPAEKKSDSRTKSGPKKLSWKESKELETIEERISEAEEIVLQIESVFSEPDFYEKHAKDVNELNSRLEEARLAVQQLYSRWEELEDKKNG
jgi:ATP-binding cassette subfamily F protein uup